MSMIYMKISRDVGYQKETNLRDISLLNNSPLRVWLKRIIKQYS